MRVLVHGDKSRHQKNPSVLSQMLQCYNAARSKHKYSLPAQLFMKLALDHIETSFKKRTNKHGVAENVYHTLISIHAPNVTRKIPMQCSIVLEIVTRRERLVE